MVTLTILAELKALFGNRGQLKLPYPLPITILSAVGQCYLILLQIYMDIPAYISLRMCVSGSTHNTRIR